MINTPLQPFQKMIVAHAVLSTIGFLILLPAGALLARYARTFTNAWFKGHMFFQLFFGQSRPVWRCPCIAGTDGAVVFAAGPVIIAGVALGIAAVKAAGVAGLDDTHKKWGVALLALYVAQCLLGEVIHRFKPSSWTVQKKRPMQNYFHAVFGILIIGLSFYQVS